MFGHLGSEWGWKRSPHLYPERWRRFHKWFLKSFLKNFALTTSHLYRGRYVPFYNRFFQKFIIYLRLLQWEMKSFPHLYRGRWNGIFNLVNQKSKTYLRFSFTILLHKIVGKRNTWEKFLESCLHNIGSGKSKNITTFRKIHKLFYFLSRREFGGNELFFMW